MTFPIRMASPGNFRSVSRALSQIQRHWCWEYFRDRNCIPPQRLAQENEQRDASDEREPRIFLIRPALSLRHPERSDGPRTRKLKNSCLSVIQSPWVRCFASLSMTLLRFRGHQPARKFFFEVACEVHTKPCARVQTQCVAVWAIEQQSNGSPARRTGKDPAHFA